MIKYTPSSSRNSNQTANTSPEKDVEDYLFSWIPDRPSSYLGNLLHNFAINNVFLPVAFLTMLLGVAGLVYLAFGKSSDWGIIPKGLVAVFLPALVIAMISNVRIGNIVFGLWMLINYIAFVALVLWILVPFIIASFKPYFDLF